MSQKTIITKIRKFRNPNVLVPQVPTFRTCFHSSDFEQRGHKRDPELYTHRFPTSIGTEVPTPTSIECFSIPWVWPSSDHIYRLWQQQPEVHFYTLSKLNYILLTSPKSLLWVWWIIDQMHWRLSQPFNSPSRAHSHLLLNGSRSGSNWQRWDQDFTWNFWRSIFSHPEELLPESILSITATEHNQALKCHIGLSTPHISSRDAVPVPQQRIFTQAIDQGEWYLQDNASELNKIIEFTSLATSKIL